MEIKNDSITFGSSEGSGPKTDFRDLILSIAPTQASAVLTGFDVSFSPSDGDHHLGNLDIRLSTTITGNTVRVNVTFGLRDWSGNWDDKYEGRIFFSVIAG